MTYTAELNGLDIGEGTDYRFKSMPEVLSPGDYRIARTGGQTDGNRPSGPDLLDSRFVTFEIQVLGSDIETKLHTLWQAWAPVLSGRSQLTVTLDADPYVMFGRPVTAITDATNMRFEQSLARLRFEATDPRMFSATETAASLGLSIASGFEFPLTFPLTFGATSGNSTASIVNGGTYRTDWEASIVGPVTDPKLLLSDTGEFVELSGVVPSGSVLTLSSADKSVLLNGSPRQSWLTLLSRWWELAPGTSTVRFLASAGTGSATVSWRDASI